LKTYNPESNKRTTFLNIKKDLSAKNSNNYRLSSPNIKRISEEKNISRDNSRLLNDSRTFSPHQTGNHAIKFSEYSVRKDMFKNNKLPILTYLNPKSPLESVKKTMIEFNKMKNRNVNDILNVNNYPAVCYYQPKYDFTLNNPQHTINFKKERNITKKFLVKKMWGSYDVSTDYRLVKLKDFVDEKFDFRTQKV